MSAIRIAILCIATFVLPVLGLGPSPLEAANAKQVFVYNNIYIPKQLDPALVSDGYSRNVIMQLFEGLTTYQPRDLSAQPGVAKRWEVSADGRVYKFYLDPQVKWSDGTIVTADDFVFAWRRVLDPNSQAPLAFYMFTIKNARAFHKGELKDSSQLGLRAIANDILEVTLEYPVPYFLQLTSFYTFFPVPKKSVLTHGKRWTDVDKIVSNGPFLLLAKPQSNLLILKKNTRYIHADQVSLQEVRVHGIADPLQAIKLYNDGKLDYTGDTPIPQQEITRWRYSSDFHVVPWFAVNFLRVNTTRPPFNNPKVRQALALAIDKPKVVNYIVPTGHQVAHSMVPPGISGYAPAQIAAYDPKQARALLAQAGYCVPTVSNETSPPTTCKPFPAFRMLVDNNDAEKKLVLGIQQMLKKELGIAQMEIQIVGEYSNFLQKVSKMEFDLARSRWIGDFSDPNTFLELWTSDHNKNNTGWKNQQYDTLLSKAALENDSRKRMNLMRDAETLLLAEVPVVPIYHFSHVYLLKPYVHNYSDNMQRVMLLKDVYIEHYVPNKQ